MAIGCLIRDGRLPIPDLALIVDTGREKETTWQYMREHMLPHLSPVGLDIAVAPHSLARVDLADKTGLTLMPAYTDEGRLSSFCSGEWKRDTAERWLRLQGVRECTQWLGFSMDEAWRVKKDHRPWCHLAFPLIDLFVNRAMCEGIIREAGLPLPQKSRCYCCPHQSADEWSEVRADAKDWAKAVEVEKEINRTDPEQDGLYLYSGRVALPLADFSRGAFAGRPCDSGNCFT